MPTRNSFIAFIQKEFRHIFRDKRTLIILFGIPIAQVLLFGFVITNELKNVKIAIWDRSHDAQTRRLTQKILSSGFFNFETEIFQEKDIENAFKSGKIKEVIVFEEEFAKKLQNNHVAAVQLIADASDANSANMVINYTSGIIAEYTNELNANIIQPLQIVPKIRMLYNEELRDVYLFIPGIMAMILMLLSAMMTSISVAREKESGTLEILLVSPLNPIQIILGKVTPYFLLSFINAVVILLIAFFIFDMPIFGNITLLMSETMLFILLALSLGILISTIAPNQQTAMMVSMFALMLPTILLSGFIFPIENMPQILQYFAALMPPKYFIIILKNVMLKGTGIAFVWKETLTLMGMTLLFIGLSVKQFKIRLE
jgi:ABC-2 type transport system permease protein